MDIEQIEDIDIDGDATNSSSNSISILKGQMIGSIFYILVLIISIIILYNQILKAEKKEPFLSEETVSDLNILNRVVVLLLVLYFFYTTLENIQTQNENNRDPKYAQLQSFASLLTIVSAIIVLYVSLEESNKSFVPLSATDNPNL